MVVELGNSFDVCCIVKSHTSKVGQNQIVFNGYYVQDLIK